MAVTAIAIAARNNRTLGITAMTVSSKTHAIMKK
jgi:hypothetical protein